MTLTEAAAAGTPSVASDIVGHRDAMAPGSGLLASDDLEFEANVRKMLADASFRTAAGHIAHSSSKTLNWDTTATELLKLLVADADRLQR